MDMYDRKLWDLKKKWKVLRESMLTEAPPEQVGGKKAIKTQQRITQAQEKAGLSDVVTYGTLQKALDIVGKIKRGEIRKEQAKNVGGSVGKVVAGFLGPIGSLVGEAIDKGMDAKNIVSNLTISLLNPKDNKVKKSAENIPWMQTLKIDDAVSYVIEDEVETRFIKEILDDIMKEAEANPDKPLPDFNAVFKDWLNKKFLHQAPVHVEDK
jgi:hypothetical protein